MTRLHELSDDELTARLAIAAAEPSAPDAWLTKAEALLFGHQPAVTSTPITTQLIAVGQAAMRRIVAELTFDSWTNIAANLAVRGGRHDTRHLLYNAAGRDIDLRIRGRDDSYLLSGQILGPDDTAEIELHSADAAAPFRQALLDELGEFHLDAVPAGSYRLILRVGDDEIELPSLLVGSRGT